MKGFPGFPAGKVRLVSLPSPFFSELLPAIDSLSELKVTLHIIWLLDRKTGYPRYVSQDELLKDTMLLSGFSGVGLTPAECVREGLEQAVARGTILRVVVERDGLQETFFFLNSEKGRQAVEQLRSGKLALQGAHVLPEARVEQERPNIFVLYEQNIGLLQPMIVEELQEAEKTYPREWIEEAFREAVLQNKRSWRYIQRILERWAAEGKGKRLGKQDDRQRYVEGKYAEYFKQRPKDE